MDPAVSYLLNKKEETILPDKVEFNMNYIIATTAVAGIVISYLLYKVYSYVPSTPRGTALQSTLTPDQESDEAGETAEEEQKTTKKIGVKKAAKLEMKAEKRAARLAMLQEREEKKLEQEHLEELRKVQEEKERKEEEEREEQERLAREEQAKKEHEAYLEMAATFEVEEEGYDPDQEVDSEDKLAQFIKYINDQKVVLLEHLAAHFKMRTKDVVDRIQHLVANGSLIGIIDDRGKFISITNEELKSVSKFIRQRGRVTVDELVINSNKLINLKTELTSA